MTLKEKIIHEASVSYTSNKSAADLDESVNCLINYLEQLKK